MTTLELNTFEGVDVRHTFANGDPVWVAKDVCQAAGISKYRDAVAQLDADERVSVVVDTPGGPQYVSAVTEAGVFQLILIGRSERAQRFKRWVTHDVLPAIRKTGQYGGLDVGAIDRKTLAQWVIEEVNRRELAEAKVAELEPQAAVARNLVSAKGDMSVRECAQSLCRAGIPTGERRLFAELKRLGWISDSTHAYQRQIDIGRIRVRTDTWQDRDGETHITRQVRVTPRGLSDLHRILGGDQPLALVASP